VIDAFDVDLEDTIEVCGGSVVHAADSSDTGIVDEDVDTLRGE
jgi:hypothetical protein